MIGLLVEQKEIGMSMYEKTVGNITLTVSRNGAQLTDYEYGCELRGLQGSELMQDKAEHMTRLRLSVEQLHDLRHMIDRALAAVERERGR